jgi:hypothetical protein
MSSQSTIMVYRARPSQGTWSSTNQLVKKHCQTRRFLLQKRKKSMFTSLHIPAPHSRSHTTCNVVARVQKNFLLDAIATCQASLQQNRERTQSFLDRTLGEDNRSVQILTLKPIRVQSNLRRRPFPHGILALNAIPFTPQYHERRPFHT